MWPGEAGEAETIGYYDKLRERKLPKEGTNEFMNFKGGANMKRDSETLQLHNV